MTRGELAKKLRKELCRSRAALVRAAALTDPTVKQFEANKRVLPSVVNAIVAALRTKALADLSGDPQRLELVLAQCEQVRTMGRPAEPSEEEPDAAAGHADDAPGQPRVRHTRRRLIGAVVTAAVLLTVAAAGYSRTDLYQAFDGEFVCDPGMSAEKQFGRAYKLTRATDAADASCWFVTKDHAWFPLDGYREVEVRPLDGSPSAYWVATFRFRDAGGRDIEVASEPRFKDVDSDSLLPQRADPHAAVRKDRIPNAARFTVKLRVIDPPGRGNQYYTFRMFVRR